VCIQPVQYVSGHVDNGVLERMGKIMSYLRVTAGKKKDKLAALHGMGSTGGANFPIVHGTDNIMPKAAGQWVSPGCRSVGITWLQVSGYQLAAGSKFLSVSASTHSRAGSVPCASTQLPA